MTILQTLTCQKHSAGLIDQRTKSAIPRNKRNVSEHAQEPPVLHGMAREAPPSMPPVYDGRFLTETESIHRILGKVEIETIIKRINGKKLKQTERNYLSRSIRPKLIGASILCHERILEKIGRPKKTSIKNQIISGLSLYGYDLMTIHKIKKQDKLSIYELITKILIQETSPRFIEAIPIVLIKNKINPYTLLEFTARYDLKNKIGYLLQTSFIIAKKLKLNNIDYLKDLLKYLKATKDKQIGFLVRKPDDERYLEFLKKTSPKRMKEWNLLGRFFDKDFISNAETYLK